MPGMDLIEINGLDEELGDPEGELSTGEAESPLRNLVVSGREFVSLDVMGLGVEGLQELVAQVKKCWRAWGGL